jgi:hypothetical protein
MPRQALTTAMSLNYVTRGSGVELRAREVDGTRYFFRELG